MSVFRKPATPNGLIFLLRGEPGTGKTRFALGLARLTPKRVAILGNDRGAARVAGDPAFGNVAHLPITDASSVDAALAELEDHRADFGGVIVDSITDWWNAEQKKHEIEKDGERVIPMRAWRTIREEHEDRLRILTSLGLPVILVSQKRPLWERVAGEIREIGSREDTDKKDSYLADVRLRFFAKNGAPHAEILKDRTGRFRMGAVVEHPTVEAWLDASSTSTTAPALEFVARELIDHLGGIQTADHWKRWRRKHSKTLETLLNELPESRTKRKLVTLREAKKAQFAA